MSTTPAAASSPKSEIKIVSHSGLFYWWPVWAAGYLMAVLTFFGDYHMATVADGTKRGIAEKITILDEAGKAQNFEGREVLIAPADKRSKEEKDKNPFLSNPGPYMARSKNPGVLFCVVLLLVIVITNIPLRGLWSVMVIITIILFSVIFALMGVWDNILRGIGLLDVRINMAGYVVISTVLLIIWLIAFLFFDQQVYMIFTPGQFRVRLEIGEGETAYDTTGMTIQKQRSDLFRHWILGLGSGDLIVRTSGAQAHHFDLPNVLFLGRKVKEIEEMLRTKQVTAAPAGTP
jgi:hypothetical protein